MDAERYKDNLREAKYVITKLEFKMEKLADRLEILKDDLNQVFRIRTNKKTKITMKKRIETDCLNCFFEVKNSNYY
jgi:hypothetical protein